MADTDSNDFPPLRYGLLHDLVGHLLRHAYNRAYAAFETVFEGEGLTPLQFMIFELVQQNPGVSHSDIARAMGTAPSVVTTTMKPLLSEGRIRRATPDGDSRQRIYEPTPEGLAWFARIRPLIARSEDRLTAALGAEQRSELVHMLRLLLDIEQDRDPGPGASGQRAPG